MAAEGKAYKVRVALNAKVLWSTFHKQIYEVENKFPTFFTISLLWHLKRLREKQI